MEASEPNSAGSPSGAITSLISRLGDLACDQHQIESNESTRARPHTSALRIAVNYVSGRQGEGWLQTRSLTSLDSLLSRVSSAVAVTHAVLDGRTT